MPQDDTNVNPPWLELKQLLDVARLDDAILAITEIGIPELLPGGDARPVAELAEESNTRADLLARLLRFLVAGRICTEPEPLCFGLSEMGMFLRDDETRSLRAVVMFRGQPFKRRGWTLLGDVMRTGDVAFERLSGAPLFDYYDKNPEAAATFNAAMTGLTRSMRGVFASHYDFSRAKTIVDIGGGEGALLMEVLEAAPVARGVPVDQSSVAEAAKEVIGRSPMADRCTVTGGSFFEAVPPGGDIYMMKMILHDWPDEQAGRILRVCRAAMAPDARLLIIERVLPSAPPYDIEPFMLDLVMLLELGALERTEAQWRQLLKAGGFELARVVATPVPLQIIEARPA